MNKLSFSKGLVLLTTALFLVGGFFVATPLAFAVDNPIPQCIGTYNVITAGTSIDDIMAGTPSNDFIDGGDGNNTINGGGGNDCIVAGSGNDTITTTTGNDVILAGNGNNTVSSGDGNDTIITGSGNDIVSGGAGTDTCDAGSGANTITECEASSTVVLVNNLQPSFTATGGGGVFSAYIGPPDYVYVSPGTTALYDTREAGIIKAGFVTTEPWDEGLFAFIPNVTINDFASGTLTYDVVNQFGVNPVWMTIEIDTGTVDVRADNTTYQFVPTTNLIIWHTVDAGAGLWQKWNNGDGDVTGNLPISLSAIAADPLYTGLNVVRTYLRLGMGSPYYNGGTGTTAWVDQATIGGVTYDFVLAPDPSIANVSNLTELNAALADMGITTINITANISAIPATVVVPVGHPVTINGGGFTLTFTGLENPALGGVDDGLLIQAPATINNLIVNAGLTTPATWVGTYAIHIYNTTATLNNVTATNGNGGILVNGSAVILTGITTVSGNGFGGIEVSASIPNSLPDSILTVTGTLVNTTEAYGKPTIWLIDGQGTVTGANVPATTSTTIVVGQTQYYLIAGNSVTYTLTYTAGANGTLTGTSPQTVNFGASGTAVTAVPDPSYHFVSWSDGVLTASRTDTNVTVNITVSASFALTLIGPPTNKDQCKDDGWKIFNNPSFKNQGDCVSFVEPTRGGGGVVGLQFFGNLTPTPTGQVLGASTGPIPGCDNRTTGFSVTTGQSCVGNSVVVIPGCGNRTTGFSVATGQSCVGNSGGQVLGAEKFIFTTFMKIGSKNGEVPELQKFLNTAGHNSGNADGKFGPKTKAAVIKFQLANGLVGDGIVGALTRAVLNK